MGHEKDNRLLSSHKEKEGGRRSSFGVGGASEGVHRERRGFSDRDRESHKRSQASGSLADFIDDKHKV